MSYKAFSTGLANLKHALPGPLAGALACALLVVLGVAAYLSSVIGNFPGELSSSAWVQSHRSPALDVLMAAISQTEGKLVAMPVLIAVSAGIYLKGWRFDSLMLMAATFAGYTGVILLKQLVARPRPSANLVQILGETNGYSFPSAHVMVFTSMLGTLAFIVAARTKHGKLRVLALGITTLFLLAVGYSRIYLGAHWLSDVIGGYAFGLAVIITAAWLINVWNLSRSNQKT